MKEEGITDIKELKKKELLIVLKEESSIRQPILSAFSHV